MQMTAVRRTACALLIFVAAAAARTLAEDDPCAGFKWDVSKERALFASAALSLPSGKDGASAASVATARRYLIELSPASQVTFPLTPGKPLPAENSYAGLISLHVPSAGHYRVAVDLPLWIDVVSNGKLLPPVDYEGQHDCHAPRKIVEFALEGKRHWILQLSGASEAAVNLVVTRVPAG